jgi:dihydropteroate synthase
MATQVGIKDLILDPGFGFAKQLHHNYTLLNQLDYFEMFNYPLMVGVSRKKMIQQVVSANADGALNGTSVVHTIALLKGARILRTHDVKEAAECIKIVKALNGNI